jgi:hypothetical protein
MEQEWLRGSTHEVLLIDSRVPLPLVQMRTSPEIIPRIQRLVSPSSHHHILPCRYTL